MTTVVARKSLLLVDDHDSLRDMLGRALTNRGYDVSSASCGTDALSMSSERIFDVVVLDIKMPGMNGLEVLRKIREMYPDVPVIILSAVADPEMKTESQAMQLRASVYLHKPCKLQDLDAAIQRVLRHQ
ncbi:MAG: response regulator [Dehalococcoidia bacterium]|nr:response regulator [Dehalococcoidia bacterium]